MQATAKAAVAEVFRMMREALASIDDPDDRNDVDPAIHELEAAVHRGVDEDIVASAGRLERLRARVGNCHRQRRWKTAPYAALRDP